jgi:integrase
VEEVQAIRREMEGDRLIFVGLALGLREGEAFGVRWSDLDLDPQRGLLDVRQQVQPKRGGGFEFVEPKTKASKSALELTRGQVGILLKHRRAMLKERLSAGSEWEDYDLVFPSEHGTPLSASNVRKHFNAICDRAGVRRRRIHDWRVTAGSWLADLNVHPDTAKQVLRHTNQSTTMKHYTHTSSERRREALEALDKLFNG